MLRDGSIEAFFIECGVLLPALVLAEVRVEE